MTHNWFKETEPVENAVVAITMFADAYDHLLDSLSEHAEFAGELRAEIYKPVRLSGVGSISIYEIGIAHSPNNKLGGRFSIDREKLEKALEKRGGEIASLFAKEDDGLLPRLCALLSGFIEHADDGETRTACIRLLNECRRLLILME